MEEEERPGTQIGSGEDATTKYDSSSATPVHCWIAKDDNKAATLAMPAATVTLGLAVFDCLSGQLGRWDLVDRHISEKPYISAYC